MTQDYNQELIYQLLQRCKSLERELTAQTEQYQEKISIIDVLTSDIESLAVGDEAGGILISVDEAGKFHGHTVTSVSGGADYVGDFETGFPRQLTLSRFREDGTQATYYHESVLKELEDKLSLSVANSELLHSALESKF